MRIRCRGLHHADFGGYANALRSPGNKVVTGSFVMSEYCSDYGDEKIQEGLLLPVFEVQSNQKVITGLVLKLSDEGQGVYRRVGRFSAPLKESLINTLGQIVDGGDEHLSRTYAEVLRGDSSVTLGYMVDII
ncbi:hypothetical protein COCMIDRAFT_89455 [Bipolaris oryzae ATCC 44560]|uniref:Uncharacterized protein n=1 Tax=Bipolaris oryzae ATCC 44560 TaxID=930090 RepID=W6ZVC1_COCMI|nr:uncharacterized protein COCMIDRAFT_89455 [Bipolaris oryzae ATCC 44560]EUC47716.1 hypothetical protein COCMIDRAFT_89455 [Bipolaris oryzae ATCC 44560]